MCLFVCYSLFYLICVRARKVKKRILHHTLLFHSFLLARFPISPHILDDERQMWHIRCSFSIFQLLHCLLREWLHLLQALAQLPQLLQLQLSRGRSCSSCSSLLAALGRRCCGSRRARALQRYYYLWARFLNENRTRAETIILRFEGSTLK